MAGLKDLSDRELLVKIHTRQKAMDEKLEIYNNNTKEAIDSLKSVDAKLEIEDDKLHHRINEVHSRVNTIKFWSIGTAGIGSMIGSFIGWFTGGKQ